MTQVGSARCLLGCFLTGTVGCREPYPYCDLSQSPHWPSREIPWDEAWRGYTAGEVVSVVEQPICTKLEWWGDFSEDRAVSTTLTADFIEDGTVGIARLPEGPCGFRSPPWQDVMVIPGRIRLTLGVGGTAVAPADVLYLPGWGLSSCTQTDVAWIERESFVWEDLASNVAGAATSACENPGGSVVTETHGDCLPDITGTILGLEADGSECQPAWFINGLWDDGSCPTTYR